MTVELLTTISRLYRIIDNTKDENTKKELENYLNDLYAEVYKLDDKFLEIRRLTQKINNI